MGWIIDKDFIGHHLDMDHLGVRSEVGTGYGKTPADGGSDSVRFRLYDDDGHLYYAGRIARADLYDGDEIKAFAPLAWAERNAGCTEMRYLDDSNKWQVL